MKFTEVICLTVILTILSSMFGGLVYQLIEKDKRLARRKKETDSLNFISKSFCNSCNGKGFSSLDEWKSVCGSLWQLENIEWSYISSTGGDLFYGKWAGPYGSGEVYAKK